MTRSAPPPGRAGEAPWGCGSSVRALGSALLDGGRGSDARPAVADPCVRTGRLSFHPPCQLEAGAGAAQDETARVSRPLRQGREPTPPRHQ